MADTIWCNKETNTQAIEYNMGFGLFRDGEELVLESTTRDFLRESLNYLSMKDVSELSEILAEIEANDVPLEEEDSEFIETNVPEDMGMIERFEGDNF